MRYDRMMRARYNSHAFRVLYTNSSLKTIFERVDLFEILRRALRIFSTILFYFILLLYNINLSCFVSYLQSAWRLIVSRHFAVLYSI